MKQHFGAPQGSARISSTFTRAMVWGPHEVGGAELGAERR